MKTHEQIVDELRREAQINAVCGSEEWTELLNEAANRMEHMELMLRAIMAATLLSTARRRALKGMHYESHKKKS